MDGELNLVVESRAKGLFAQHCALKKAGKILPVFSSAHKFIEKYVFVFDALGLLANWILKCESNKIFVLQYSHKMIQ
jgi:hypothetical protein